MTIFNIHVLNSLGWISIYFSQ